MERRAVPGLWGGLWAPPQFESEDAALAWCTVTWCIERDLDLERGSRLEPIDHSFTHFDLRLVPLHVRLRSGAHAVREGEQLWYPLAAPPKVGLPQPIRQLIERLAARRA
jgi:A/G-specific adenine glycosylase